MDIIKSLYNESPTKQKTREKIIESSFLLFSEYGIAGLSMKDVADKTGITVRNLYRYYNTKEFLAIDVAFYTMDKNMFPIDKDKLENMTGIQIVSAALNNYMAAHSNEENEIYVSKFLLYFDLYLELMDKEHPAYIKYTREYVSRINNMEEDVLYIGLVKGVNDGTVNVTMDEVSVVREYMVQSLHSLIARTTLKVRENSSINRQLVEKHLEVLMTYFTN